MKVQIALLAVLIIGSFAANTDDAAAAIAQANQIANSVQNEISQIFMGAATTISDELAKIPTAVEDLKKSLDTFEKGLLGVVRPNDYARNDYATQ